MEIITRDQLELHMVMYCVRVAVDRQSYIEELVVKSAPRKKEYGDHGFFMWEIDVKNERGGVRTISVTDMGIEQIPQYNLHATFTTRTEAINYEHTVRIDYDGEDKNILEFGDEIYKLDEDIDPNEMIPFDFEEMSPELEEMCSSWAVAIGMEKEENLQDASEYVEEAKEESAYDRAMKLID